MKLVKYRANWADEIDVEGFRVMDEDEWYALLKDIENAKYPQIHSIGTNEEIDYGRPQDLREAYRVAEISEDDAGAIEHVIGREYGFFYYPYDSDDDKDEDWEDE